MGVLRGSTALLKPIAESLSDEFRRVAQLERADAINAIAAAIRKGDVRAAVWFLANTGDVAVGPEGVVTGVIAPERIQPQMAGRQLALVDKSR